MTAEDYANLELAARAAGLPWDQWVIDGNDSWNPLTDDGDALRLAVILEISPEQNAAFKRACALWYGKRILREELFVSWGDDKYAATRRAIVLAAAEIGRQMQNGGEA